MSFPQLLNSQDRKAFWNFWLEPTSGHSAALFRILLGLLAVWASVFKLVNMKRFYSNEGVLPWRHAREFPEQVLSVISLAPESDALLLVLGGTALAASVCLTLGYWPRFSAFLLFYIELVLQHRNPYVHNSGDRLFLVLLALAVFLPLGRVWSLGRSALAGRMSERSTVWSQRLIALQMSYIYFYAFSAKIGTPEWRDGSALYAILSSPRLAEWPIYVEFPGIVALLTWGTLLFELIFPIFVWFRKWRFYCLLAGVLFHGGIDLAMRIPMFSAVMVVGYVIFLSDSETQRLVEVVRGFFRRLSVRVESEHK